jgi:hypothetical protein
MTAQGDLVAYLDRAITAQENAARAACAKSPWRNDGGNLYDANGDGFSEVWSVSESADEDYLADEASAAHIALNDPESVLRRCAADRKLIALHQPDGWACKVCANEEQSDEDSEGEYHWSRPGQAFPCPTIEALAEGYGWTEGER